jgi:AcrR family transcriptional regulator
VLDIETITIQDGCCQRQHISLGDFFVEQRSYHHGDLRGALINTTLEMIRGGEVHLIGFRELARRLDVSRTAPYRHFLSVEHLKSVVVEEGFQKFVDALEKVTGEKNSESKALFLELGLAYIHFGLENPAHYRLMFDPLFFEKGKHEKIQKLSSRAFALLRQTVEKCLPPDTSEGEKTDFANLAWATVHGITRFCIDGQWNHIRERETFLHKSCERLLKLL